LATTDESIALITEDVAYQVKARYARIISWEELQPSTRSTAYFLLQPPWGRQMQKTPSLKKKLAKGDARWNTSKEILGYMLNGRDRTMQLPPAQADALLKELKNILKKK
jgi:hypothetical protein